MNQRPTPTRRLAVSAETIEDARRRWADHGWRDASDGMAAITSVLRAQRLYQSYVDLILAPYDLNASRYEVLMLIYFARDRCLPAGVIVDRLQIGAPTATNTLNRLEVSGYVKRTRNPDDGRGRICHILPDGVRVAEEVTPMVNASVFESTGLQRDELTTLTRLISRIHLGAPPHQSDPPQTDITP